MITNRQKRILWALLTTTTLWIIIGEVLAIRTIENMYSGESIQFLNTLILGQDNNPLEFYVAKVHYLFAVGIVAQLIVAGVLFIIPSGISVLNVLRITWNQYWFRMTPTVYLGITRVVCISTTLAACRT